MKNQKQTLERTDAAIPVFGDEVGEGKHVLDLNVARELLDRSIEARLAAGRDATAAKWNACIGATDLLNRFVEARQL